MAVALLAAILARTYLLRTKPPPDVLLVTAPEDQQDIDIGTVTAVVVKASMKEILHNQFMRWPSLQQVTVEEGVNAIGDAAFFGCPKLETVVLPDSLQHIRPYAFGDCFTLREVRCGKGLSDMGQAVFGGCSNLLHVYYDGDAPTAIGSRIYVRTPTNLINHVKHTAKGWGSVWPPDDEFPRPVIVTPASQPVSSSTF